MWKANDAFFVRSLASILAMFVIAGCVSYAIQEERSDHAREGYIFVVNVQGTTKRKGAIGLVISEALMNRNGPNNIRELDALAILPPGAWGEHYKDSSDQIISYGLEHI